MKTVGKWRPTTIPNTQAKQDPLPNPVANILGRAYTATLAIQDAFSLCYACFDHNYRPNGSAENYTKPNEQWEDKGA